MGATGITKEDQAKKEITAIPNGGRPHDKAPEFFSKVHDATACLYKHLIEAQPELYKIAQDMAAKKKREGGYSNPKG
eukprot:53496-Eustigmatos_ZCMA.PRE.1